MGLPVIMSICKNVGFVVILTLAHGASSSSQKSENSTWLFSARNNSALDTPVHWVWSQLQKVSPFK